LHFSDSTRSLGRYCKPSATKAILDAVPKALEQRALLIRAEAVRGMIAEKELDPFDGLARVLWPSRELREASLKRAADSAKAHFHPDALRRRGLELVAAGRSQREVADELGIPRTTVQMWVRRDRRERGLANTSIEAMPASVRGYWTARVSA
jgi:DNA-binding CsgD family transcriptional regulator